MGVSAEEDEKGNVGLDWVCILVLMSSVGEVMAAARPPLMVPAAILPPKERSAGLLDDEGTEEVVVVESDLMVALMGE